MEKSVVSASFFACLILAVTAQPLSSVADNVDITFEEKTLSNGLRVIVHEDHKAPIVAVNLWYHVGSKNEQPGKTGFAHLFEHLMFNGSENYAGEYFEPFKQIGVTNQNGTTYFDRTNYFQTVPSTALDTALWLESDRMGHLLGAVTEDSLTVQRGVVQNEKRQSDNQPYGGAFKHIIEAVFPPGHPYSWLPIGSMEDLDAATMEDVQAWFKTYYGPNNAVLSIAGDVNAQEVFEKVDHYFGDIPAGPPISRHQVRIPKLNGIQREIMQDRVPQAKIYKVWVAPNWTAGDADALGLVGEILAAGKNSRLYERLVYRDQIATDVSASPLFLEIAGAMVLSATVTPDGDIAAVEKALDEELNRFLTKGPTRAEVKRIQTQYRANFVRGIEKIGGFGGKSDILAQNAVYSGDPSYYKTSLERVADATQASLQAAAKRWLGQDIGHYVLEIHPFPELSSNSTGADRSSLPMPDSFPSVEFDDFERGELSNGLKLIVANRSAVPVIQMQLVVDSGYAADKGALPGTATLAMSMLDEGTKRRDALEISEQLAQIGARVGAGANLDTAFVSLNTLSSELDDALDIYADVILNPAFPAAEINRLKDLQIARIKREQVTPIRMALRVFPKLLYGDDHAYGIPLTGSGTIASTEAIDRSALENYHQTWFKPNNATLIIVGDTNLASIKPSIEKALENWARGAVPQKKIAAVAHKQQSRVYLIDRPESEQSIIFAGHIAPPKANPNELAIDAMNGVLGGDFTSRINMNLREDKHWAYGAYTFIIDAKGPRPFIAYAPVQSDKTAQSMAELKSELTAITAARPPNEDELARVRNSSTLSLPGRWESASAVAGSLSEMVRFGLPDDYWKSYPEAVRDLTVEQVITAAKSTLRPDNLVWVVVGDRARIQADIEALELGEIAFIDSEGTTVE